jgi:protein SCO1/2
MKCPTWLTPALFAVTALLVGIFASVWLVPTKSPQPYPGVGGDFTLSAISGPVALSDFKGKAVLVFFGYTHCPDVCPTDLARIGQVLNALTPAESTRVRGLFISIDPERDTPQRIADYTRFFHPSIIGLTGTPDDLHRVAKQYLVLYQKAEIGESQAGYLMDHSTKTYLVGRDGYLAKVLGHELEASQVLAAVRDVLMSDA